MEVELERGVGRRSTSQAPARLSSGFQPELLALPHPQHLASYRRIPSFSPPRPFTTPSPLPTQRVTNAVESLLHLAPSLSASEERKQGTNTAAVELDDLRDALRRAKAEVEAMNATMAWMQRDRMEKEEQWKAKEATWGKEKAELEQRIDTLQHQLDDLKGAEQERTEAGIGHSMQGAQSLPLVMPTPMYSQPAYSSPAPSTHTSLPFTHATSSAFAAPSRANGSASSSAAASAPSLSSSATSYPVHPHPTYPPPPPLYPMLGGAFSPHGTYGYPGAMSSIGSPMSTLRAAGMWGAPSIAMVVPASASPQRGSNGRSASGKRKHSHQKN